MNTKKLTNSAESYGTIAKWLHWSVALFFLLAYCTVYYRHWFTEEKTPENWIALQLHLSIGITIGALVVLRILWKIMNVDPTPEPATKFQHLLAKLGHMGLYFVMVVMPLTGYMGTGVDTEFFQLFNIPKFEDTTIYQIVVIDGLNLSFEAIEPVIDFIHKDIGGQFVVWMLILGHALAAAYHHFIKRDNTLKRMI